MEKIIVTTEARDALYRGGIGIKETRRFNVGGLVQLEVANEVRQKLVWSLMPGETLSDAVRRIYS